MTDSVEPPKQSNGRDTNGRFAVGNPGGPGAPRGRRALLRQAAEEAISVDCVKAVMLSAARKALQGDVAAMRVVLEHACGRPTGQELEAPTVHLDLPELYTADDCNAAVGVVLRALTHGEILETYAKVVIEGIQARLKALEQSEYEARLAKLEETAGTVNPRGRKPWGR
jgi:hypothetical protein